MAKKTLKCPKCDRTFLLPAHLARHKSASHGAGKKKTGKKATPVKKRGVTKIGRPMKRATKRVGRPRGVASRLGLRNMSLDQLAQVIDAARDEARRRLAELEATIR